MSRSYIQATPQSPLPFHDKRISDDDKCQITSIQQNDQSNKRPGNNKFGNTGTNKCQRCRKLKARCEFEDPNGPCNRCQKAGKPCGPKVLASHGNAAEARTSTDPRQSISGQEHAVWLFDENFFDLAYEHAPSDMSRQKFFEKIVGDYFSSGPQRMQENIIDTEMRDVYSSSESAVDRPKSETSPLNTFNKLSLTENRGISPLHTMGCSSMVSPSQMHHPPSEVVLSQLGGAGDSQLHPASFNNESFWTASPFTSNKGMSPIASPAGVSNQGRPVYSLPSRRQSKNSYAALPYPSFEQDVLPFLVELMFHKDER